MSTLARWNTLSDDAAAAAVLPCCGSYAWAGDLAARRPLATLPELLAASDAAWWKQDEAAWREAFDSHPRIGEQHAQAAATTAASLAWSAGEQSAALSSEDAARARLADGNRAYEAKFGRIFIVCATGKSAGQMLQLLTERMTNTAEAELHEAAEQQRQITHLRLAKWLAAKDIS